MKNKLIKKLSNITMLFAILFNLVLTVNAATAITTNSVSGKTDTNSKYVTNKGTLKVTNLADENDRLTAYKILDTLYNEDKESISYEFTSDFKRFLSGSDKYKNLTVDEYTKLTNGDITSSSTKTTSTLDTLVSSYASFIRDAENNVLGTPMTITDKTAEATVEAVAYLVLPTETTKVYAVMVGNVDFTVNNSEWTLNDETIVAKTSDVSITKTVEKESYNFSDEQNYTIKVTVPTYPTNATNRTFEVSDTFSNGLTYDTVSLKIMDGTNDITETDGVFTPSIDG